LRKTAAEVSRQVLSQLREDVRLVDEQKAERRASGQKLAAEALQALEEHKRAYDDSSSALEGAFRAADAALAAVAALERLRAPASGSAKVSGGRSTLALTASSSGAALSGVFGAQAATRRRTRRIDGITA